MDPTHFRQRAARAREMAQSGDDFLISRMLLDLAHDLEAEAEAIEGEAMTDRRRFVRVSPAAINGALLHKLDADGDAVPVRIVDISTVGAKLRVEQPQRVGDRVTLDVPSHGLHLHGAIVRMAGSEAAMIFDTAASVDIDLIRLLRPVAVQAE